MPMAATFIPTLSGPETRIARRRRFAAICPISIRDNQMRSFGGPVRMSVAPTRTDAFLRFHFGPGGRLQNLRNGVRQGASEAQEGHQPAAWLSPVGAAGPTSGMTRPDSFVARSIRNARALLEREPSSCAAFASVS